MRHREAPIDGEERRRRFKYGAMPSMGHRSLIVPRKWSHVQFDVDIVSARQMEQHHIALRCLVDVETVNP